MTTLTSQLRYASTIITRWATEGQISPFAVTREWIRALSNVARNAPAPAMVVWDDDGQQVLLQGQIISIPEYKIKLQGTLQDTLTFLHQKVLRGLPLPPSALGIPNNDSYNQTTRGYGLFMYSQEDLDNPDHPASRFLEALCVQGVLCRSTDDGDILWDQAEVARWSSDVSYMLSQLYILLHMLSPPGRGTEEILWQYANSADSCRHLFQSRTLKSLVMIGNYDKGTTTTGLHKCIVRIIHTKVA